MNQVDFPVYSLDMSPYLLDADEPVLYDLYAVSNHIGNIHGGHYTAFCKNQLDKKWYKFDDSSAKKMEEGGVCSHHAYLLFYRKRDD